MFFANLFQIGLVVKTLVFGYGHAMNTFVGTGDLKLDISNRNVTFIFYDH